MCSSDLSFYTFHPAFRIIHTCKHTHTHTHTGIFAIKKNEIMTSAATWMDLEIIILSEAN